MMKFTMNAKELKTMMEKGISAINKKAALPTLTKLYFQVEENGTVKVEEAPQVAEEAPAQEAAE